MSDEKREVPDDERVLFAVLKLLEDVERDVQVRIIRSVVSFYGVGVGQR